MGVSKTFRPITEQKDYIDVLFAMVEELYERLTESRLMAKTMTLELKTVKFDVKQRSNTFNAYIYRKRDLMQESVKLLKGLWPLTIASRLMGIRLNNIRSRAAIGLPDCAIKDTDFEQPGWYAPDPSKRLKNK